jgi:hypothetical protein
MPIQMQLTAQAQDEGFRLKGYIAHYGKGMLDPEVVLTLAGVTETLQIGDGGRIDIDRLVPRQDFLDNLKPVAGYQDVATRDHPAGPRRATGEFEPHHKIPNTFLMKGLAPEIVRSAGKLAARKNSESKRAVTILVAAAFDPKAVGAIPGTTFYAGSGEAIAQRLGAKMESALANSSGSGFAADLDQRLADKDPGTVQAMNRIAMAGLNHGTVTIISDGQPNAKNAHTIAEKVAFALRRMGHSVSMPQLEQQRTKSSQEQGADVRSPSSTFEK